MKRSIPALVVGAGIGAGLAAGLGAGLIAAAGYFSVNLARRRRVERRFGGRIVVITGSSRGLGLALAEEFGRRGARLVLTARDALELDGARQQLLARKAVRSEADILVLPCDLREPNEAQKMIETAIDHFGKIDVLVNNAGIITVGPVEDQPVRAFTDAIESNYYSALYPTLAVLLGMLQRREGSIVNITSIGGKIAVPHLLPYSASKFATVGFSQGLHAELRSKGVRVTTVCPGLMRTGSHIQALFTGDREREYRWFSLCASMPGLSTSAKSAARKIVRAAADGATEVAITPQAMLASRLSQVAPSGTARLMSWVNDLALPQPTHDEDKTPRPGRFVNRKELTPLTRAGVFSARRYNQHGSP